MQEKYEKILYELSKKAYTNDEVPVAAIIVRNNVIISKAYNKRHNKIDPLSHAEINCIIKATKKLKDWRLSDCDMYVTLEPCSMCREIIKEVRIKNVYYYVSKEKVINSKTNFELINNNSSIKHSELLTNFFKKLR